MRYSKKGRLFPSAKRRKNRGQNFYKKTLPSNRNPLENEVILTDSGTTQVLQSRANDTPVRLDPLENEVILTDSGTTQVLQSRVNDTPVLLNANITVPYIKHEIVEQVVSQTLPCHTLSQEIVEPIISRTLPCHTLRQSFPVASSSRKSEVINITKRILPQRSPIDLPYDAVCTERIDEPVPDFLPEKKQWIVKKKIFLSTGGRNGKTADSRGVKRSDVAGKRFMTLGETNLTSNKLYKTRFTYSSAQRELKPQLDQSMRNSRRNLLIRPAVPNVSSNTVFGGELIPPEKIKVEDEFEVVENEFHESPETVISSLNQEKWNNSVSGSCFKPATTMIARSPSTQWFMNSCTSAVTTETVTTFASTSDKTVCTSTSALSNSCLSSTSTTPILVSSYAQPSIPSIQYVPSLPINLALNVPMILVPQWQAAKSNSDLIFNSLLPTQSSQSPSMVTNLPFVANNLSNPSVPNGINDPSSNVNSSLPIQTVVLNPTINSTLCDTNLSSTLGLANNSLSLKVDNGLTVFDKDANFLPDKNNALSNIDTVLSDMKNTTLSDTEGTTMSGAKITALSGTKITTLSGTKGTNLSGTKGTILSGTKGTNLSGTKGTNLSGTKGTNLSGTKGTTLSGQNNASLSYRTSTTLCDRQSITSSDRNNATLSDRDNTYVPDRNTTALLDIMISNVLEQNAAMLSNNRITSVYPVGEPSTVLSLNNSARTQDSLTALPSDAASFASEAVSNDEGAKKNKVLGKKAQHVLEEVADKLSKILPDTSFVKYLTDPDFYFFIGLMPLIHMLSLQQKVHARIMIKGILYDLAFPATSKSPVHSN